MHGRSYVNPLLVFLLSAACVGQASAGLDVPPPPPVQVDFSQFQTKSEAAAAQSEMKSQIPQPAETVPPTEMTGGAVGTPGTYRPADSRQPRITRSATLTLAADGTGTFNWLAQGALTGPDVQVVVTPVYTGTGVAKCWATAATVTSASVKCVIETVALISIAGINVGSVTNTAPASMKVGVVVLPTS